MVRQLVKFMGRKRVALRTRWHQTVHAAVVAAEKARRVAEVHAWKEQGMAVQVREGVSEGEKIWKRS